MHSSAKRGRAWGRLRLLVIGVIFSLGVHGGEIQDRDACLIEKLREAGDAVTVGALRRACDAAPGHGGVTGGLEETPVVTRRLAVERETMGRPFVITPHRPNYFIFAYHFSDPNSAPFAGQFPGLSEDLFKRTEAQFQISLKSPLAFDLLGSGGDLYFGYTNRSFWQSFQTDDEISSPFRESNHEPEIWLAFANDWRFLGFTNRLNQVGFSHQSNGRTGNLSRSWNRAYATFVAERGPLALGLKAWWRIPEAISDDDNPDIEEYMGNFELLGVYSAGSQTFSAMGRHNLESDTPRGALQLDWSFPLSGGLRGYLQFFHGYGQNLIDYDHEVTTLGLGIQLNDWL